MPFSIRPIDAELFASIYTPAMARELDEHIYASRSWIGELSRQNWAIDEERRACMFWVHMPDRVSCQQSYVFAWNQGVVLIRQFEVSRYSIVHASPRLNLWIDEVRSMMREALLKGGKLLDGPSPAKDSTWASGYAESIY